MEQKREKTIAVLFDLEYRSGVVIPRVAGLVRSSTPARAQKELEDTWKRGEIVAVQLRRFNGELAGWG